MYALGLLRRALALALLALAAFSRVGAAVFSALDGLPWWAQAPLYAAMLDALLSAADLPFSLWAGFVRERRYGFSTQTLTGFLADRAKGALLGVALSAGALTALVACARVAPAAWPVLAAAGGALALLLLSFLAPLLLEPLFNRFAALADAELAAELQALGERAGLPLKQILVADASRRTSKSNAYVSGLGATRRLVLYDTLIERASHGELALVLAHELGHRRARHIAKGVALAMSGIVLVVVGLWAALHSAGLRGAIGATGGASDPRVIAFVLFAAALLELLAAPAGSALSRRFEREADRFSLELTGDPAVFEATHRSLALANLSDLDPPALIYAAFFSHPTAAERIELARAQQRGAT